MMHSKKTGMFFGIGLLFFVSFLSFPKNVQAAANTLSLTASPTSINAGDKTRLRWVATGLDFETCDASGGNFTDSRWRTGTEEQWPTVTTTYTLHCYFGAGGPSEIIKSVTVTVLLPPIPTITLSATPNPIDFGGTGAITLRINGSVASCVLSNGGETTMGPWAGYSTAWNISSLTLNASPPSTLTWSATCVDAYSRSTGTQNLEWRVNPPPAATATLTLNGMAAVTIGSGVDVVLRWGSTNAVSCTASSPDPAFNGVLGTSGEMTVSPTSTTNYSIFCTDVSGANGNSVLRTITVSGDVPTITMSLSPSLINAGDPTTVTWNVTNATSCTGASSDGFWSGNISHTGDSKIFFPSTTTSYNIQCASSSGGTASQEREVTVASASCNNGSVEPGEECDNGSDNGTCPATCSLSCRNNACSGGGGPTTCTDALSTCGPPCSSTQVRTGFCGGTNECCKPFVETVASSSIEITNPIGFSKVEDSLDSILGSLQAIITIISIIFIVIGGILYTTAAGDESRVKTAKGAITAAMVGLAIGVAAPSFLKQIGAILGWGPIPSATTGKPFLEIATNVLNFLLSITGIVGIIMLVIGGIMYMTSAGDEGRMDTGKKIVQYSIIGIAIALGSLVLVTQLARFFS